MRSFADLLALATKHVTVGETCLARQMAVIERLRSNNHPTELANQILDAMIVALDHMREDKAHMERRNGIKAEF